MSETAKQLTDENFEWICAQAEKLSDLNSRLTVENASLQKRVEDGERSIYKAAELITQFGYAVDAKDAEIASLRTQLQDARRGMVKVEILMRHINRWRGEIGTSASLYRLKHILAYLASRSKRKEGGRGK